MTNEERRNALNTARRHAEAWAVTAETNASNGSTYTEQSIAMACMWAQVANAMKVGDPQGDHT